MGGIYNATSGLLDFWTSGLLDFWTSGLLDFWTSGLLDFWTSGLLADSFSANILKVLGHIFTAISGLVLAWAIYIGFIFGTASDPAKRTEAKKRLFNAISIFLIVVALTVILPIIPGQVDEGKTDNTGGGASQIEGGSTITGGDEAAWGQYPETCTETLSVTIAVTVSKGVTDYASFAAPTECSNTSGKKRNCIVTPGTYDIWMANKDSGTGAVRISTQSFNTGDPHLQVTATVWQPGHDIKKTGKISITLKVTII